MKLLNGRYTDNNNNSWDGACFTKEEAQIHSESLINCHDCSDCSGCFYCHDCSDCSGCSGCFYCHDCSDCSGCSDCRGCRDCRGCSGYEKNPETITSAAIGSRGSSTIVYWIGDNIQVVCGCFRGSLSEFEAKVKKVYDEEENVYRKQYLKFIKKVKTYMERN